MLASVPPFVSASVSPFSLPAAPLSTALPL